VARPPNLCWEGATDNPLGNHHVEILVAPNALNSLLFDRHGGCALGNDMDLLLRAAVNTVHRHHDIAYSRHRILRLFEKEGYTPREITPRGKAPAGDDEAPSSVFTRRFSAELSALSRHPLHFCATEFRHSKSPLETVGLRRLSDHRWYSASLNLDWNAFRFDVFGCQFSDSASGCASCMSWLILVISISLLAEGAAWPR
jgi:hypothetical protein